MSYTNVEIPDRFSTSEQYRKQIFDLQNAVKYLNGKLDQYEREFYNIPEAVKDYGFVDLKDCHGKHVITLVEKKEVST